MTAPAQSAKLTVKLLDPRPQQEPEGTKPLIPPQSLRPFFYFLLFIVGWIALLLLFYTPSKPEHPTQTPAPTFELPALKKIAHTPAPPPSPLLPPPSAQLTEIHDRLKRIEIDVAKSQLELIRLNTTPLRPVPKPYVQAALDSLFKPKSKSTKK